MFNAPAPQPDKATEYQAVDLDELLEALQSAKEIACDIETTDLDIRECRVTSIQFAIMRDGNPQGWVVNFDDQITLDSLAKKLAPVLQNKSKLVIFHNASFDVQVLALRGFHFRTKLADTMIMAWLNDEDRKRHGSYGLKQCVLKYLDYQMSTYEEARSLFGSMDDYAADDAKQTLRLYHFFLEKLSEVNLVDWFHRVEMPVTRILIEAEMRGVQIDGEQLKKVKKECYAKLAEIQEEIYKISGYAFDIASPKQLARVLFDELNIGIGSNGINEYSERGKSGDWSTSNEVLEAMKRAGHKIADLLLDFREFNTRLNVFINPLLERFHYSPIIHPRFVQTATVTGRFASRDPNYQNLPRKGGIRKAFVARPGYVILRCDYSQAELRLMAHMSNDPVMIEIYRNNGDIHKKTAESCGISRQAAKACVAGDSLVLTEHGYLRIDEIVEGPGKLDKSIGIMSDDGIIRNTEATYCPGKQAVVEVHTEYGMKVTSTLDHEFMVMREGKVVRLQADQLKIGDPLLIMVGKNIHGKQIKLPEIKVAATTSYKDIDLPEELTPTFARYLGYFVSEGRQLPIEGPRYQISIGLGNESAFMIEDVEKCFKAFVGTRYSKVYNKSDNATIFVISSKKVSAFMDMLGAGRASSDKCIPRCIREAPWELKKEFLRAYFEGDGTNKQPSKVTKRGPYAVSACSKSETLIRQLQAELANVGILGYINTEWHPTKKGPKKYYFWGIRHQKDLIKFKELIGFLSPEKQAALDRALEKPVSSKSSKYLDGIEPLLEQIYTSTKGKTKDKLREIIRRGSKTSNKAKPVRFSDTRLEILKEVLPEEIKQWNQIGIWTAQVKEVIPAGETMVYDLYEPVNTAMVVGCNIVADCNFGIIYRMSGKRLQSQLALQGVMITTEDSQSYVRRYFTTYPNVKKYHQNVERKVMERLAENGRYGWVKTLGGRYRRLERSFLENRELQYTAITQAINTTIQGGVADLIKEAMVEIQRIFVEKGWLDPENGVWDAYIQGQVHDELMIECKKEIAEEVKVIVVEQMEEAGRRYKIKVPMTADAAIVEHLEKG